jgi:hypothetical protein
MRLIILSLIFFVSSVCNAQQKCDCDSVFTFVYGQWDKVNNMSYHSAKTERKMGVMESAEFDFVIQRSPFKVAGVMAEKKHRILYDPAQNEKEALYIPNGFPFTNLWLDINGHLFRGLNHYTISNAGCNFIFGIIRNEFIKMPEKFTCTKKTINGEAVIQIYAETDDYSTFEYTGLKGETVLSISEKFKVLAYALIEYNDNLNGYTDDCEGLKMKVPTHYGSKVNLVVSAKHGLPNLIQVSDPKGLIQQYKYTNYKFDLKLDPEYFTEDYQDSID